jgi:signal transduction histidine kinase/ActR/RegA family two-component response regulator
VSWLRRGGAAGNQAGGQHRFRGRLFLKYVAFFVTVVCLALLCNDLFQLRFSIRDYTAMSIRIQQGQADAAAAKIGQFVTEIEGQLGWIANMAWDDTDLDDWRFNVARLLHQEPPVMEFAKIDALGRERLRVSRFAPEVAGSLADRSADPAFVKAVSDKVYYGPVDFRVGSEPYMTLSLAGVRREAGVSVVSVNLKFIQDVMAQLNLGNAGRAYVVDAGGRLIAHSDMTMVLSRADFSKLRQVRAALAGQPAARSEEQATTEDINGAPVLAGYAVIAPLGWRVLVESPVEEALAPLHAALLRTGFVLVAALILASLAGLFLAHRMVVPIRALVAGAARIGSGDLSQRLSIKSGDEFEVLGAQFNSMATQLQESYATLEGKVDERTRELELANLAKSRFIAVASHDLRQPLHALGLFVGQLRAHVPSNEGRRLVERIDGAVVNMNELFAALLDISKLDAGVLVPDVTEFPLQHLLARMDATFAAAARTKGLSLRAVPTNLWVRSDAILLERILQNLVSNAVRFAAGGGVVIGARRRGRELRIDVCDSGPGIPKDRQRDVFGEFCQIEGPHQDAQRGLGLGLAIVDRLCRLLGHRVELDSTPGRGSRFSIFVPLVSRRAEMAPPLAAPPSSLDLAAGKLVLVIDDDAMNLESLGGLLANWGCRVVTAATCEQALDRLAAEPRLPDIVISDYHLSNGMSGDQAIARLRERFGQPVPALLMSGDTSPELLRAVKASSFALLHKPVPPMKLRMVLNQLLKSRTAVGAD